MSELRMWPTDFVPNTGDEIIDINGDHSIVVRDGLIVADIYNVPSYFGETPSTPQKS